MMLGTVYGGGQALTSVAHAATTTSLNAVQQVWLRSTPAISKNGIVLEPKNEQFTVVSGSTSRWWRVQDAQGRTGYVIRNTNWIQQSAAQTITSSSTSASLVSVRNVWLRETPKISRNGIVLEPRNEQFTVTPGRTSGWWHVQDAQGRSGYVIDNTRWIQQVFTAAVTISSTKASSPKSPTTYTTTTTLPRGVTIDPSITPIAPLTATWQQKFDAVLSVAESKLGTKYVWGHNEDRGQYGFDCSNFTAYVYHHALGYKFSGASQVQNSSVGNVVPEVDMRPGDLLIFENGAHVGIYIGNSEMIQCGGGLGEVGYLSVKPGTYWGDHITSVRRML